MISILVITHGSLGAEIVRTAECIVGKQSGVTVLSVTGGDSLETMRERTRAVLDGAADGGGTLVLTDMPGGTPSNSCLPFAATHEIEIVGGVNLYMLISAFMNRTALSLGDLARRVIDDGRGNISNTKEAFLKRLA